MITLARLITTALLALFLTSTNHQDTCKKKDADCNTEITQKKQL